MFRRWPRTHAHACDDVLVECASTQRRQDAKEERRQSDPCAPPAPLPLPSPLPIFPFTLRQTRALASGNHARGASAWAVPCGSGGRTHGARREWGEERVLERRAVVLRVTGAGGTCTSAVLSAGRGVAPRVMGRQPPSGRAAAAAAGAFAASPQRPAPAPHLRGAREQHRHHSVVPAVDQHHPC